MHWTSYTGYFREVTRMCFAVRQPLEREQMQQLFRNLTVAQLLNTRMLQQHSADILRMHTEQATLLAELREGQEALQKVTKDAAIQAKNLNERLERAGTRLEGVQGAVTRLEQMQTASAVRIVEQQRTTDQAVIVSAQHAESARDGARDVVAALNAAAIQVREMGADRDAAAEHTRALVMALKDASKLAGNIVNEIAIRSKETAEQVTLQWHEVHLATNETLEKHAIKLHEIAQKTREVGIAHASSLQEIQEQHKRLHVLEPLRAGLEIVRMVSWPALIVFVVLAVSTMRPMGALMLIAAIAIAMQIGIKVWRDLMEMF
jgi:hypothetical protein